MVEPAIKLELRKQKTRHKKQEITQHKYRLEVFQTMINDNHVQRAGDGAQQIQAGTIIINNNTNEERVREICKEVALQAIEPYTQEAYQTFHERVEKLEDMLIPYVDKTDGMLAAFADPAFQILLRKAQQTAAATEREDDYALLSELLVCHVQKGNDRKNRAGITQAIEIVDQIDNDALCALTVAHAVNNYLPIAGSCVKGLQILDSLFHQLIYQELPHGTAWLDHLDVLGTIRILTFMRMGNLSEKYISSFNGYVCVGIKLNSDNYQKAIEILNKAQITPRFLVPNECLDGYVRLNIRDELMIDDLVFRNGLINKPINDNQKSAIKQIFELYSKDPSLQNQAKENFMKLWDSHESLYKLRLWWDNIPNAFQITRVGEILAYTNAKRCSPDIPDLI